MFTERLRGAIVALVMVALAGLPSAAVALSPTAPLANFPTERSAQAHCPVDTIVWLNLPTGIYHMKGMRWYGATKSGTLPSFPRGVVTGELEDAPRRR